jgi:hypothetical protein
VHDLLGRLRLGRSRNCRLRGSPENPLERGEHRRGQEAERARDATRQDEGDEQDDDPDHEVPKAGSGDDVVLEEPVEEAPRHRAEE